MLQLVPGVFPLPLPSVRLPVSSLFVYFQLQAVLLPSSLPLFKSHTCDSFVVKHLIPFNYKRLVFTPSIVISLFNPPETPSGFAWSVIPVSVLVCRSTLSPDPARFTQIVIKCQTVNKDKFLFHLNQSCVSALGFSLSLTQF